MKRTIGGERLGSGKKMTADLKTYNRSSFDMSYAWRSTMAAGTLVPFMTELGLPGDTFDIDLNAMVMTHPTVGPLFGSYKVQLDVFMCPIRLYQAKLHNNKLGIGLDMAKIKLPQIEVEAANIVTTQNPDNQQVNPSSILAYLNIRGLGRSESEATVTRKFNALPYLSYWDIYKNYYANKSEEIGAMIHNVPSPVLNSVISVGFNWPGHPAIKLLPLAPLQGSDDTGSGADIMVFNYNPATGIPNIDDYIIRTEFGIYRPSELFLNVSLEEANDRYLLEVARSGGVYYNWEFRPQPREESPVILTFPLENIDNMREDILEDVKSASAFVIDKTTYAPYGYPLHSADDLFSLTTPLEGLGLKTYQSDLFNNWIDTEWMDGTNGVSEVTAVDTSSGSFTMDTLNMSKKVYDMLNRIMLSGGSYKDWINTVYTSDMAWNAESPIYMGGLIKELQFQEVISQAAAGTDGEQPLGTLAGKGVLDDKHKGGKIRIKVDEPSYIIGIVSLTPRVDYSQGNKWDVNLKTMDDLHKPALDEIGFQDLITDQMAFFDTVIDTLGNPTFKSAGKQPAWLNYMTNVNKTYGNFAIEENEMFMTLNRKYEIDRDTGEILDLTTYIDPVKFNNIFAQTSRDAQNFWVQIGVGIEARRVMSSKIIPNL